MKEKDFHELDFLKARQHARIAFNYLKMSTAIYSVTITPLS